MSHPDYEQFSHDHAALLILVRHVGTQLKQKTFNKFYDRISKVNLVKIPDSTGQVRNILVRYVKEHPVENNDWGDFQTHRRLLGLISLGKYDTQQELNEICRVHESLKVKYTNTLFDSRCILFGANATASQTITPLQSSKTSSVDDVSSSDSTDQKDISITSVSPIKTVEIDVDKLQKDLEEKLEIENKVHENSAPIASPDSSDDSMEIKAEEKSIESTKINEGAVEQFTTPSNFKTRALFYSENDACADLENHLSEFINSLFWVLESKRLIRSREKLERVSLLYAPFEKKDFVGLDMESRNNKKRCTGRMTKHLGDLCLQVNG